MEFLTLQDFPQRHMYNSRRMATPDDVRGDRTLPALPAVRPHSPSSQPLSIRQLLCTPPPPPSHPPPPPPASQASSPSSQPPLYTPDSSGAPSTTEPSPTAPSAPAPSPTMSPTTLSIWQPAAPSLMLPIRSSTSSGPPFSAPATPMQLFTAPPAAMHANAKPLKLVPRLPSSDGTPRGPTFSVLRRRAYPERSLAVSDPSRSSSIPEEHREAHREAVRQLLEARPPSINEDYHVPEERRPRNRNRERRELPDISQALSWDHRFGYQLQAQDHSQVPTWHEQWDTQIRGQIRYWLNASRQLYLDRRQDTDREQEVTDQLQWWCRVLDNHSQPQDRLRTQDHSHSPSHNDHPPSTHGQNVSSNSNSPQSHTTRHSPPVQPNEAPSNYVELPSFSQVQPYARRSRTQLTPGKLLKNVHSEPSPPRTPNRNNGSTESSPVGRHPSWDEVSWGGDSKRRRLDSTDGHFRPPYSSHTDSFDHESRRPSALDPALAGPFGSSHHRPSLPFVHQPAPGGSHARHQSSPIPQAQLQYQSHAAPAHHSVSGPSGYHAHPVRYERRPSYYPETQTGVHGDPYERGQATTFFPQGSAYMNPSTYSHPVSHQGYQNYSFQSAVGVDPNAFSRKRRGNLPKEATAQLKKWFADHRDSPYPTEDEKMQLCQTCGLTLNQVSNWFINARRRAPKESDT